MLPKIFLHLWKKGKGEGKGHGWGTMATIGTRKTRWETGKFWAAFTHPISFKTDKDHALTHRIHKKRVQMKAVWGPPYYRVLCKQKQLCPFPSPVPFFHKCRPAAQQPALGGKKGNGGGEGAWVGHHGHH